MKWLLLLLWIPAVVFADHPEGTWEGVQDGYQLRLVLDAEGTFELSADAHFPEEIRQEFAEYAQIAGTRPIESLSITVAGRWTVEGESVSFQAASWEASTNIGPFAEAMLELAKGLARALAAEAEISEEEYPALEEEFVAEFLAEADPMGDIDEWLALGGAYDEEGDVLVVGDVAFTRAATAVQRASWGQIKEGWK